MFFEIIEYRKTRGKPGWHVVSIAKRIRNIPWFGVKYRVVRSGKFLFYFFVEDCHEVGPGVTRACRRKMKRRTQENEHRSS